VSTFGPGAMLDLPRHSVLVGGLDSWSAGGAEIIEPRLARRLAQLLDVPSIKLLAPPLETGEIGAPSTGIECFQFPEWFITQGALATEAGRSTRSRRLSPHVTDRVPGRGARRPQALGRSRTLLALRVP